MKRQNIKCPCGATSTISSSSNLGDQTESTDFTHYLDISDGLDLVWLCPVCEITTRKAIAALIEVFGDRAPYIHFASKMPRKPR